MQAQYEDKEVVAILAKRVEAAEMKIQQRDIEVESLQTTLSTHKKDKRTKFNNLETRVTTVDIDRSTTSTVLHRKTDGGKILDMNIFHLPPNAYPLISTENTRQEYISYIFLHSKKMEGSYST